MSLFHIIMLALIQGITEFLPISSSGHLILLPELTALEDQGATLDVAVHVGTLAAVIAYFWSDVRRLTQGLGQLFRGQITTSEAFLALAIILATIPVIAVGLVLKITGLDEALRSITVIGWTMLLFGLVLYWIDQKTPQTRHMPELTLKHAFQIGLCQAVALIPGTSRAGICITGARALGYTREEAARIAMLMSIPTILAAGVLTGADVAAQADWQTIQNAALAALLSCFAALIALALMMRFLKVASYTPYVVYRVILGLVLLGIAYT